MINLTSQKEIWTNRTPSWPLYCRPIKFVFNKENPELVRDEYNAITEAIKNRESDVIDKHGRAVEVSYEMHCTMIDGAVANVLTNTNSSSRCFICHAYPTEMNNTDIQKIPNIDNYKFGLSTLHCWIRFLDCILHIAYRITFKKMASYRRI